jgi:hypothetical protein
VGLSNGQACGSCAKLSLIPLFFTLYSFLDPWVIYVRNITLFNRNISSIYNIVAMHVIKHPGHTYRGFGSTF